MLTRKRSGCSILISRICSKVTYAFLSNSCKSFHSDLGDRDFSVLAENVNSAQMHINEINYVMKTLLFATLTNNDLLN